ncbi:hypothetical protein PFICI_11236 [Pestalotiopsis fici W106-1]|uniref:Uncharacterized protein n=1 Tax=Pestalotiopsis fici (strain W106-1 / CGMCC3.15140) TaxID=1229662 RepID=W3WW72_PESFW|nr:uncharacterized protein PFICI_11236 [Pestalotiopsis fici W106-1]ETS77362.1 hypothetical protein PFICI_11236 [Pestalotiopsis fici W106-1]
MAKSACFDFCPKDSDNQLYPRVHFSCRSFDFTLLFQDVFFIAVPASLMLIIIPIRLRALWTAQVQVKLSALAIWKLSLYILLFTFHILFLALRQRAPRLVTTMSIASGVLSAAAVLTAGILSFLEHQRSSRPSDLLVLYFSASAILYIPTLRSLWSMPCHTQTPGVLWVVIYVGTILLAAIESARKTQSLLYPPEKDVSPEGFTGIWSRGLFAWTLPFLRLGFSDVLQLSQIPQVGSDLRAESTLTTLRGPWQIHQGNYRLIRAVFSSNKWLFLSAVPPRLSLSAFMFCQPFLIEASVSYLNSTPDEYNKYYGRALVGAFVLAYAGVAISRALYMRQTYRLIARIRCSLVAMMYQHTTGFRAAELQDSSVVTLMGTDVERIAQALRLIHELWVSIPEVGIAVWLLARQMSWASVVPLIVCLVSVVITSRISASFGKAQVAWNERVQKRVATTAGMLTNMKAVQMLGMSNIMNEIVTHLRMIELKTSERFRAFLIWQILLGNAPVTIAPFATFTVYAIIAVTTKSDTLLSAQAFTALSLISLMTTPLIQFCQALPYCVQSAACFGRIQEYCLKEQIFNTMDNPLSSSSELIPLRSIDTLKNREGHLIHYYHADIAWSSSSEPILRDLTLDIGPGLTAIVGPVASGKSTLLWSMLGETALLAGTASHFTAAAFCAQTPWIMDETIQHNITMGLNLDREWYNFSIYCACLYEDLTRLPRGDQTLAGSNGASLSGGQRQRVAIARAVYSKLPIVILDDVMSGLDAKTVNAICSRLFSHFRKAGISAIVATHTRSVLPHMDTVLALESGHMVQVRDLVGVNIQSAGVVEQVPSATESPALESILQNNNDNLDIPQDSEPPNNGSDSEESESVPLDSERQRGNWAVYSYYCRSAGLLSVVIWITCSMLAAVFTGVTTIWVEIWTDENQKHPNQRLGYYLGIYALFMVLSNLAMGGELWYSFIKIISDTALHLHTDILDATLRAPFQFFQEVDVGSITNRFSQDMDLIDMVLPSQAAHLMIFSFSGAASCLVQLIILCVLGKYLAATIPIFLGTLFILQKCYLRTSRQVRLIDIEAKAPLYKQFIETVSGVTTIRAYRRSPYFRHRNAQTLDISQGPYYMLFCVQQWLVLVLDLIVVTLAVIIVAIALTTLGSISAGELGVALVLILQFNSLLSQSIQAWTKLEISIGAVSRIQQYVRDTPSESAGDPAPHQWPSQGAIRFDNVVASYAPHAPPALHGVTLSIRPGERIAICGPSGSGKTTLLMTLLRMTALRNGLVSIDGTNVSTLSPNDLRAKMNVLPQEPFFMPGTIRFNLDPRQCSSEHAIRAALDKVGLLTKVESNGGLEAGLDSRWSQGENQLLCLARALLVPSKILILDEATSNVDDQTEGIMLDVIGQAFKDHTVISVIHRLSKIDTYDRVVVLKDGRLIESDSPASLLEKDTVFRELYQAYVSGH